MSSVPGVDLGVDADTARADGWLEAWRRRLERKIYSRTLRPDLTALIADFSGRPIVAADHKSARLLQQGAILPSNAVGDHDVALLLAIIDSVLHGSDCHVLSAGNAAFLAAERWSPVLDRMGISTFRLDGVEPARRHRAHIGFGTVRDAGLAWLRQTERDSGQTGPLQQLAQRLAPGKGSLAFSKNHFSFDRAVVLDADEAMGRTSLGGIVGTRREEGEELRRELIQDTFGLAAQLREARDFTRAETGVTLTPEGRMRTQALSRLLGDSWKDPITTEFLVVNALETLVLWRRDVDFHVAGQQIEVLSPALAARLREANPGISATDMIAVREAPQDNRPTGKATNRTSVRSMLLRYEHLCGLARHAGRYAAELHAAYGVTVRTSRAGATPDEITGDARLVLERVRKLTDEGHICIIESCADAESDSVRDMLGEAGISLTVAAEWPQPELDLPHGGVVWALPRSNDQAIERLARDPRTALIISLSGADFRHFDGTDGAVRLALIRTSSGNAETSRPRRAANLAGLLPLAGSSRWRSLQLAANDQDAFMRQQLFAFDQYCRRAVDFAQTARKSQ